MAPADLPMNFKNLPRSPLTPEALETLERVARTGSFAGAAREMGKVPSALTYSMRALEDALDVLLFDRSSRQARLTPAGEELLREGQRLLRDLDALTKRVKRVATGWEAAYTIAADSIVDAGVVLELIGEFYRLEPPTRITLRQEVLTGTWEALVNGSADLALGVGIASDQRPAAGIDIREMGEVPFVFVMSAHHVLARSEMPLTEEDLLNTRAVAIADSARDLAPLTLNLLPGQPVLTVPSIALKIEAIRQGLGCGWLPVPLVRGLIDSGVFRTRPVLGRSASARINYAWRSDPATLGLASRWWLDKLERPEVRARLLAQTPAARGPI